MKIQRLRFRDRIAFTADISSEVEDALIPPFVIQSFVENSVKYAVDFERQNICTVKGTLIESHGELFVLIEVRDNGKGYQEEVLASMKNGSAADDSGKYVGIRNVRQRLALVFGDAAQLILKNEEGAVALISNGLCPETHSLRRTGRNYTERPVFRTASEGCEELGAYLGGTDKRTEGGVAGRNSQTDYRGEYFRGTFQRGTCRTGIYESGLSDQII